MLFGFGGGMVAFLAMTGGKTLLLLQHGADSASLDPYTAAFAGLMVGLFTERAFDALGRLVVLATPPRTGQGAPDLIPDAAVPAAPPANSAPSRDETPDAFPGRSATT